MRETSRLTTSYCIRVATVADLEAIDRLADKVLAEHGLPEDSAVARLDVRYFPPSWSDGGARFWVALAADEIIGSAAIVPGTGGGCTFKTFYVKAEYRRRHVGLSLYNTAEAFAREAGYRSVQLYVSRRFRTAIQFYMLNGYWLVEATTNQWDDSVYRKDLYAA